MWTTRIRPSSLTPSNTHPEVPGAAQSAYSRSENQAAILALGLSRATHLRGVPQLIDGFDGFVFVTPEYNHSTTGVLKNAIDYLYAEWNNKAAGFVGYGVVGAARAVEHLRLIAAELQLATVRSQVALSFYTDFENFTTLTPGAHQFDALSATLDQVVAWSDALAVLRK
ncbi:NAD(P)H-dependent oxidoreductase [Dactylosporangium sp. NPDC049140]|uniref:NADPH-dependent FMN reductase n=1 Tax=Dactylosporangium sp. NPDC049140 TaxID=3155647 RepID=UPI00340081F3